MAARTKISAVSSLRYRPISMLLGRQANKQTKTPTRQTKNKRTNKPTSEWASKRASERTNEWTNKQTNTCAEACRCVHDNMYPHFVVLTAQCTQKWIIPTVMARCLYLLVDGKHALLLLCSQPYLWGSPFFVIFLRMRPSYNPTIEVVTFRLREWCVLDVFLLPAFTRLGHECQDLLCAWDGMHVRTDHISVYTHIRKSFRE